MSAACRILNGSDEVGDLLAEGDVFRSIVNEFVVLMFYEKW